MWKCTLTVEYIAVLRVATLIFGENKMAGRTTIFAKQHGFKLIFLCTNSFNLEILPQGFVMQRLILINVNTFVAYMLNLPLNTQRPHYFSQRAGKWSLTLAHDKRLIYRAPTYIAVPLLGPHQPRYIESTLYRIILFSPNKVPLEKCIHLYSNIDMAKNKYVWGYSRIIWTFEYIIAAQTTKLTELHGIIPCIIYFITNNNQGGTSPYQWPIWFTTGATLHVFEWNHGSLMASQITSISTLCSKACSD